ncbi:MAG: hypothetical protein P4L22_03915 [Candidatus Babeliales bacterium]|nr:hypothetical protein [Candidatus Babeliales bacterium]
MFYKFCIFTALLIFLNINEMKCAQEFYPIEQVQMEAEKLLNDKLIKISNDSTDLYNKHNWEYQTITYWCGKPLTKQEHNQRLSFLRDRLDLLKTFYKDFIQIYNRYKIEAKNPELTIFNAIMKNLENQINDWDVKLKKIINS